MAPGWSIFFRSLFVQSSWNFAGMQNLGFFFCIWPALVRRTLPAAELARIGVRHLRAFNTHPYFAGLVAATVAAEEERGEAEAAIDRLKVSLMCALGAVGDEFFWATLRPFAAVAALPAALAGLGWAPLIMLVLYNVPHLAVRAWGINAGLTRGKLVVESLQRRSLSRTVPLLRAASIVVAGFFIGAGTGDRLLGLLPGRGWPSVGVSAVVFAFLLAVQSRGLSQAHVLASFSALAAVAGAVRVVSAP